MPRLEAVRRRGRPPRTDEQRASQRERLLSSAMQAIRDNGPDVSLVDMAATAGVSKPVLYDEFGDKQGVADAIGVHLAGQVELQVIDYLSSGEPIDVPLATRAFVDAVLDLIEREPQIYAFIVRQIRSSDRAFLDNALVHVIHARTLELIRLVTFSADEAELELVTDSIFGMVFGAIESWSTRRDRVSRDRLIETLAGMIEKGLSDVASRSAK